MEAIARAALFWLQYNGPCSFRWDHFFSALVMGLQPLLMGS
jgi:hypothetical protein